MFNLKTNPPAQSWAVVAAWACLFCVIPSVLWRIAMLGGIDTGFAEAEIFRRSTSGTAYVIGLDLLQVAGGILCLGLVYRWGEIWPSWIPRLAGKEIDPKLPFCLGTLANIMLYIVIFRIVIIFAGIGLGLWDAWTPADGMDSRQVLWLTVCYVPMVAWPPLLTIALWGFWQRRRPFLRSRH